jgi:hypothetical protein
VIRQLDQITGRDAAEAEAAEWERAFEQRLLDWAAGIVRAEFKESTWLAFWRTAFEKQSPQQVAGAWGSASGPSMRPRAECWPDFATSYSRPGSIPLMTEEAGHATSTYMPRERPSRSAAARHLGAGR